MKRRINLIAFALLVVLLSSCTSHKNLIYFQPEDLKSDNQADSAIYKYEQGKSNVSPEYRLQPHDMVYVQIFSTLDNASPTLFQSSAQTSNVTGGDQSIYLSSYEVNPEGNIDLPTIGLVNVLGMTLEQAQEVIKQKASEFSDGIIVTCRMVTFRIKVAGEVAKPGVYTFYQPSVNVFDALVSAGDLTYYGNRQKVRIIRKNADEDAIYTLDIRKASVMKNKNYYLRPGDIVYVEPNKRTKSFSTINPPLTTITSSISLIASIVAIIVSIHNMSK